MSKPACSLLFFLLWLPLCGLAVERHALVIGNSNYTISPLKNPRNDATDMAAQLKIMGYQIYSGGPLLDLDRLAMERAVAAFARSLPANASALFYFAGHGMAIKNDNYLIPVNHGLQYQEQLPDRAVSQRSIVDSLKNANPDGINVLLLDACRDNPLANGYRSSQKGLQRLNDIPRGIFIGYAADSGQIAADGIGRNGTYTGELLQTMAQNPDVIVEIAHKEVARRVYEKTNGKQFPVSENKVYGNWCFADCQSVAVEKKAEALPANDNGRARIEIKPAASFWKIAGGVALGLVIVGLATRDDKDSSNNTSSSPSTLELTLLPPR